jgi:hypothetical protein
VGLQLRPVGYRHLDQIEAFYGYPLRMSLKACPIVANDYQFSWLKTHRLLGFLWNRESLPEAANDELTQVLALRLGRIVDVAHTSEVYEALLKTGLPVNSIFDLPRVVLLALFVFFGILTFGKASFVELIHAKDDVVSRAVVAESLMISISADSERLMRV